MTASFYIFSKRSSFTKTFNKSLNLIYTNWIFIAISLNFVNLIQNAPELFRTKGLLWNKKNISAPFLRLRNSVILPTSLASKMEWRKWPRLRAISLIAYGFCVSRLLQVAFCNSHVSQICGGYARPNWGRWLAKRPSIPNLIMKHRNSPLKNSLSRCGVAFEFGSWRRVEGNVVGRMLMERFGW